jgi:hypothetical protein
MKWSTTFDFLIFVNFDVLIAFMNTFDVVMVYNFLMFFLVFDVLIFVVVTFSRIYDAAMFVWPIYKTLGLFDYLVMLQVVNKF